MVKCHSENVQLLWVHNHKYTGHMIRLRDVGICKLVLLVLSTEPANNFFPSPILIPLIRAPDKKNISMCISLSLSPTNHSLFLSQYDISHMMLAEFQDLHH